MEVIVAKSAGFCFGVERAYDMVQKSLDEKSEGEKISTFGPLIHNDRVMKELEKSGVNILEDEVKAGGTVIVRSHGISDKKKEVLKKQSKKFLDATCPYVTKVHIVTQNFQKNGYTVVVVGDPKHAEMQGIIEDLENPVCVENTAQAEKLTMQEKIGVVSQTTLRREKFEEVCEILKSRCKEIIIDDTICSATTDRQMSVRELAKEVEAVVVVGGTKSSNTKKLAEIASEFCPAQKIATLSDIDASMFKGMKKLGVTAGASTPKNQIDEVVEFLEKLSENGA
ncbi:4-hydroxy-3-methylbut-2-enyl diphosphate reductase [Candidatus Peregrinibacteria bacterium]|jgi:4-hydroxy-3-methylbut-2-en-1-yl diphosphate reductase|nr:4-hydroxy-3-methylbut-2-enyl diphosphate reductase [Candidatus Peregrinibacteria bacterium]